MHLIFDFCRIERISKTGTHLVHEALRRNPGGVDFYFGL